MPHLLQVVISLRFAGCCYHYLLVGPWVVDEHMQSNCWAGLVPEMEMPSEVDTILRATAAKNQVGIQTVTAFAQKKKHRFVKIRGCE